MQQGPKVEQHPELEWVRSGEGAPWVILAWIIHHATVRAGDGRQSMQPRGLLLGDGGVQLTSILARLFCCCHRITSGRQALEEAEDLEESSLCICMTSLATASTSSWEETPPSSSGNLPATTDSQRGSPNFLAMLSLKFPHLAGTEMWFRVEQRIPTERIGDDATPTADLSSAIYRHVLKTCHLNMSGGFL